MNVISYVRVSTAKQGDDGYGLEAQRQQIAAHCEFKGWTVVREVREVASGGKHDRQGLQDALRSLENGEADGLVVAKLDRLARSIAQVDQILTLSTSQGWAFVAMDLSVDTSTASGRMVANVLAAVAQWERETISERTRAGLAAKVALEGPLKGNKPSVSAGVRGQIRTLRGKGMTLKAIADSLQADRVPTAQGGKWHASTVRWVLEH